MFERERPDGNGRYWAMQEVVATALHEVDAHGCSLVAVASDGLLPGWTYTVGLSRTYRHPELVVVGLAPRAADRALRNLVARVAAGEILAAGEEVGGVFEGQPHRFVEVGAEWRESSDWFNFGRLVALEGWGAARWPETLQVVWRDRRGRWPGESSGAAELRVAQPVLAEGSWAHIR